MTDWMWKPGPVERVHRTAQELLHASRVTERQIANERDTHRTGARLDAHARGQPRLDRVAGILVVLEHHRQIGVAADRRDVDPLPSTVVSTCCG